MPSSSIGPPSIARLTASAGDSPAVALTSSTGKTSRMPKTAMRMPMVRKIFFQNSLIRFSTLAFTTALSKESETSSTISTATMTKPAGAEEEPRGDEGDAG